MLSRPWIIADDRADVACTVIAGRLPIRSYRDLVSVLGWTRRTRRHLSGAPGLVGHTAAVELAAPAVWFVSVWSNRADLVRFDQSREHRQAQSALRPRLRPATFAVWTCSPADLPIAWAEARRRIAAAASNS